MSEKSDNEVPRGGYWSYSYWLLYIIPGGVLYGLAAWAKQNGYWPF